MAEDEQAGDAENTQAAPVEIRDLEWDCRLQSLERIEADPDDDDLEDLFTVTFVVDGPDANAEIEIMVADADDHDVVALALSTLQGALTAWADLIKRRREAARTELEE